MYVAYPCEPNERQRDRVTCVVFVTRLACTLPSLHLVSVVFGMAILTSLHILENAGLCPLFLPYSYQLHVQVMMYTLYSGTVK